MQIRCPGCAQKFTVQRELRGKTVECGKCNLHFSIKDEVISKIGRVFPGEKRRGALQQFGKPAPAATHPTPGAPLAAPLAVTPGISILRVLIGTFGVGLILAVGTLFFLDVPWGIGELDLAGRFALVGATALLATLCFLLANPASRKRGLLLGAVGLVVVLVLPLAVPLPGAAGRVLEVGLPQPVAVREQTADEALAEMGYGVVERTRAELRASGGEEAAGQVMAVWLRGVKEVSKVELKDYLIRVSGANEYSHLYPRNNGDFLMILQGVQISFSGLEQQCLRVGKVGRLFVAQRTLEIIVADQPNAEEPTAELANANDPGFYALNLRELESLDLNRAGRAADRLARVAPEKFRPDILRRLVQLLSEGDSEFKGRIGAALRVWSEPGDIAAEAAMRAVRASLLADPKQVPESLVGFLLLKQEPAILPVLDELWRADPLKWEECYASGGAFAEPTLVASFQSTGGPLRKSAVFILAKIGGAESLTVLRAALPRETDQDLHLALKKAIAAIEERAP
jgi:hypothetical protein